MRDVPSEHDSEDGDRMYKLDEFVRRCDHSATLKLSTVVLLSLIATLAGLFGADAVATGGVGPYVAPLRWIYEMTGDPPKRRPINAGTHHGSFFIPTGPATKILGTAALAVTSMIVLFVFGLLVPATRDWLSDVFIWTVGTAFLLWLASIFVSMAF